MIKILAPHPAYSQILFLPSCEWGNVQRAVSTSQLKRSMNGETVATYVRKVQGYTLEMSFVLTRLKSLELLEFFKKFSSEKMKLIDQNNNNWIGYLQVNPLELEKINRAVIGNSLEDVSTRLNFETVQ